MVLIEVLTPSGVVGRCDARCYNATRRGCDCVCGGKNHGKGLQRALANTREGAVEMVRKYAESKRLQGVVSVLHEEVLQDRLF